MRRCSSIYLFFVLFASVVFFTLVPYLALWHNLPAKYTRYVDLGLSYLNSGFVYAYVDVPVESESGIFEFLRTII